MLHTYFTLFSLHQENDIGICQAPHVHASLAQDHFYCGYQAQDHRSHTSGGSKNVLSPVELPQPLQAPSNKPSPSGEGRTWVKGPLRIKDADVNYETRMLGFPGTGVRQSQPTATMIYVLLQQLGVRS